MRRRTFLQGVFGGALATLASFYVPSVPWEVKPKPFPQFTPRELDALTARVYQRLLKQLTGNLDAMKGVPLEFMAGESSILRLTSSVTLHMGLMEHSGEW